METMIADQFSEEGGSEYKFLPYQSIESEATELDTGSGA